MIEERTVYNPFSLQGKRILVTGASGGIGGGIALECSRMGAFVYITGRDRNKLDVVAADLSTDCNYEVIEADLSTPDGITEVTNRVSQLDGIVHCAGIGDKTLAKMIRQKDIDRVMKINFESPVLLQRELLKKKKVASYSSIVFIASLASVAPAIGNGLYSASKGAMISYAKVLALELSGQNIRVNCISPAMVWTPLVERDGELMGIDYHEEEKKYPLGRYGKPEDIAYLAVYLLSDCSGWMTGANIEMTGGSQTL